MARRPTKSHNEGSVNAPDVGSPNTSSAASFFTSNDGNSNEGRIQIAGMNVGSAFNGDGVTAFSFPSHRGFR